MTDQERLVVAQAVYKAVAAQVGTKDPGNLRGQADSELLRLYREMGVKSIDLRLGGEKVGTYSVVMGKAQPERHESSVRVTDPDRVMAWAADNPEELEGFMATEWDAFARWCLEEHGEVPDGCEVVERVTPARPAEPTGRTTLRVDGQAVAEAMGDRLPTAVAGLLSGGDE